MSNVKKPQFKSHFKLGFRWMIAVHLFWLLLVCLLGGWWGKLLLSQAAEIARLNANPEHWHRIQRMLYWEWPTFFGLLLACSFGIVWLDWGDVKRARGLQAFFASVTHELRTPLTSIRLQAESIADNLGVGHAETDLVRRLLEDTIRLEAQVERTLELARLEGGGPVYIQSLQLKPWVDRLIKAWSLDYENKVQFDARVEDILIQADATALQIIFKNLFENSVRHSGREKVKIKIETRNAHDQRVEIVFTDDGNGYLGSHKNLGQLFYKGPSSQGTGVGLYLVHALMSKMRGRVAYRVEYGFEVTLNFMQGQSHA